jgi:putative peptidoglycan lipid II flippase
MVALLSHWSERYVEHGLERLRQDVKKTVVVVAALGLLVSALLILFHGPIVRLAFGRGEFALEKLNEIGWVWVCYMLGLALTMVARVLMQLHITVKNTRTLMRCALFLLVINVALNYTLMKFMGVAGIALATSICHIFAVVYMGIAFRRIAVRERADD